VTVYVLQVLQSSHSDDNIVEEEEDNEEEEESNSTDAKSTESTNLVVESTADCYSEKPQQQPAADHAINSGGPFYFHLPLTSDCCIYVGQQVLS